MSSLSRNARTPTGCILTLKRGSINPALGPPTTHVHERGEVCEVQDRRFSCHPSGNTSPALYAREAPSFPIACQAPGYLRLAAGRS